MSATTVSGQGTSGQLACTRHAATIASARATLRPTAGRRVGRGRRPITRVLCARQWTSVMYGDAASPPRRRSLELGRAIIRTGHTRRPDTTRWSWSQRSRAAPSPWGVPLRCPSSVPRPRLLNRPRRILCRRRRFYPLRRLTRRLLLRLWWDGEGMMIVMLPLQGPSMGLWPRRCTGAARLRWFGLARLSCRRRKMGSALMRSWPPLPAYGPEWASR